MKANMTLANALISVGILASLVSTPSVVLAANIDEFIPIKLSVARV